MGKECMARLSRRLWGGTSLKTAAKEATEYLATNFFSLAAPQPFDEGQSRGSQVASLMPKKNSG